MEYSLASRSYTPDSSPILTAICNLRASSVGAVSIPVPAGLVQFITEGQTTRCILTADYSTSQVRVIDIDAGAQMANSDALAT